MIKEEPKVQNFHVAQSSKKQGIKAEQLEMKSSLSAEQRRLEQKIHLSRKSDTDFDLYEGPYVVEPEDKPVVLDTKSKLMGSDVTVKKVPVYETSNASGTTVYIGGE